MSVNVRKDRTQRTKAPEKDLRAIVFLALVLWFSVTLRREIFLLSEDFISRLSVGGVWGHPPHSKSEQPSRDDNNFWFRLGWAVFYLAVSHFKFTGIGRCKGA
jgi:hypothetical protein